MQVAPFLVRLLVLAAVAADGAVAWNALSFVGHEGGVPALVRLLLVALGLSQATLVAVWAVWSRAGLLVRGLAVLGMVAAAGQILGRLLDPTDHHLVPVWTILFAGHALGVLVALAAWRRRRLWLRWPDTRDAVVSRYGTRQFSLASLMTWLTLTAIALGPFRSALQDTSPDFLQVGFWWAVLLIDAALAMLSLVAVKLLLGTGAPLREAILANAAILVAGGLLKASGRMGGWSEAFLFCLLQVSCLAAMLLVLRVAGLRLVLRRGVAEGTEEKGRNRGMSAFSAGLSTAVPLG